MALVVLTSDLCPNQNVTVCLMTRELVQNWVDGSYPVRV